MNVHTQGPWTLTHVSGSNFAVQKFEIRGKFGDKENCYPVFNKDTSAIDGAFVYCSPQDARLIAAAPELLAELKELYAVVRGECPSLLNEDSGGNAEQDARILATIAKAEGAS